MNPTPLTELFSALTDISWRATWLFAVLLVLRFLVRGRIPAQVWFCVWIVLAVRLLTPMSIPTAWSPYNLGARTEAAKPDVEPAPVISHEDPVAGSRVAVEPLPATMEPAGQQRATQPIGSRISWKDAAAFAWLVGFLALVAARWVAAARFRTRLRQTRPADARVRAIAEEEYPGVVCLEADWVAAPALCGVARPRLLFPPRFAEQVNDPELRLVIRHELAHWRRGDLLAQRLMQLAVALHWFNPFAWLAARLARVDCELACDEFVLGRETAGGSGAYGAMLLKVLGIVRTGRRSPAAIGILEGRQQLAERVRSIAGYRAATRWRAGAGIGLVALLAVASLTRESRAQRVVTPVATRAVVNAPPADEARPVVDAQREQVTQAEQALQSLKERAGSASLEQRHALLSEALKAGNLEVERKRGLVQAAQIKVNQVAEVRANGGDLRSLAFVANQPLVAKLSETLAAQNVERAKLAERFREAHPTMARAKNTIAATESELQRAIDSYCGQLESERSAAIAEYEQQKAELESLKQQSLDLDRRAVEQVRLERQLATQNQILQVTAQRAREETAERVPAQGPSIPPAAESQTRQALAPEDRFEVSVFGAVNTQSAVSLSARDNPIVLDAIARAGGFAANANRDAVRLIRTKADGGRETVTLTEALVMTGTDPAVRLQRGDVVVVPEVPRTPQFVNVFGAVNRAGRVVLAADGATTLVHAIAAAGGQSRLADLKKVKLTRPSKKEVRVVDVDAIMKGAVSDDVVLESGDTIFVPERIL